MTTTKNYSGAFNQAWLIGIWIISSAIFISCQKHDEPTPENYTVTIQNNYFETIDSLYFNGEIHKEKIEKNASKILSNIRPDIYAVEAYTKSGLILSATVHLQGKIPQKTLTINNDGKFTINE